MKFRNVVIAAVIGVLCISAPAFGQKGLMGEKAKRVMKAPPKKALKMTKKGKPDMRFKSNKAKAHLTKSGKPDKRFKENKPKAHLTVKGKPDKRFKENKGKK